MSNMPKTNGFVRSGTIMQIKSFERKKNIIGASKVPDESFGDFHITTIIVIELASRADLTYLHNSNI